MSMVDIQHLTFQIQNQEISIRRLSEIVLFIICYIRLYTGIFTSDLFTIHIHVEKKKEHTEHWIDLNYLQGKFQKITPQKV